MMLRLKQFDVLLLWIWIPLNLLIADVSPTPTSTSAPTTHIVSYAHLHRKVKDGQNEFPSFDFESIPASSNTAIRTPPQTGLGLLFERLVERLDMQEENTVEALGQQSKKPLVQSQLAKVHTDDMLSVSKNTLENLEANEIFGHNDEELSMNRSKQSIPVLEPVKHLLNTVRNSDISNITGHKEHRHMLFAQDGEHMESAAIETEEEREMINGSTEFQLLDFLGSLGGIIWQIFMNIQKLFAASSSSASALLSSSSVGR